MTARCDNGLPAPCLPGEITKEPARERRPLGVLRDTSCRLQTARSIRPSDRHRMAETAPLAQARTERGALERGRVSDGPE